MEAVTECHFFSQDLLFETVESGDIFFDTAWSVARNRLQFFSEGRRLNGGLGIFDTKLSFEFISCNKMLVLSL